MKNGASGSQVALSDVISLVKERLEQMPQYKIPEMQFLTDNDWHMVANMIRRLDTDDDYRRAFSVLRGAAKREFMPKLGQALYRYADANDGQLPTDLSQLKSYFAESVDDAIFPRYELKQTGKLADVPEAGTFGSSSGNPQLDAVRRFQKASVPQTEPIVVERAMVDDQHDSLYTLTAYGYSFQSNDKGAKGLGWGTWATVGADGKPQLAFGDGGAGFSGQMSSASVVRVGGGGGSVGGGGGGVGVVFGSDHQNTTNASSFSVP